MREFTSAKMPGWTLRVVSESSCELQPLVELANDSISAQTKLLVLVGLHCDLTFRPSLADGRPGLLHVNNTPRFDYLINIMTTWNYQWQKTRGITVIWTLPHPANFRLYNEQRSRMLGNGELDFIQRDEAGWFEARMDAILLAMAEMLRGQPICFLELRLIPHDLSVYAGSDGVHLGKLCQKTVLDLLIEKCLELYPSTALDEVTRVMTQEAKMKRKQSRRRRRMRNSVKKLVVGHAGNITSQLSYQRENVKIKLD